jgi:transcriptional regulator with XRE-family HTH domain
MPVAHVLRDIREEKGLTLREVAARAGVTIATVLRAELGQAVPQGRSLQKLARALEGPIATLRNRGPVPGTER